MRPYKRTGKVQNPERKKEGEFPGVLVGEKTRHDWKTKKKGKETGKKPRLPEKKGWFLHETPTPAVNLQGPRGKDPAGPESHPHSMGRKAR